MDLLKRRGADPLKVKIEVESAEKNSIMPTIKISDQTSSETLVYSPEILERISPIVAINSLMTKLRKFSNFSQASDLQSPDISPIMVNNKSPGNISRWLSGLKSDVKNISFSEIWSKPLEAAERRITSMSDITDINFNRSRKGSNFHNDMNRSNSPRVPNNSIVSPASQEYYYKSYDELSDDVFEVVIDNSKDSCVSYKKINKERHFSEILRKYNVDSCIPLFKEHEIDLKVFLTLTRSDLHEIGLEMNKRDKILDVIDRIKYDVQH